MLEPGVDVVCHLVEVLAFGRVTQALALRLDVIGFGFHHTCCECRVVERAVIALGVILNRNLPIAVFRNLYEFQGLKFSPVWHPFLKLRTGVREPVFHRLRIRIEVDEDEAEEFFGAN